MESPTTARTRFAADSLVKIEIAFGALSFWDGAITKGTIYHFAIAGLLTWAFACVSLLASSVVHRYAEAEGHKLTRQLVAFSGAVLVLISGGLTFHGLQWADEKVGLAPVEMLALSAFLLSALNVILLYAFVREIDQRRAAPAPQRSLDATVFGSNRPAAEVLPAPRTMNDPQLASIVSQIEDAARKRRQQLN